MLSVYEYIDPCLFIRDIYSDKKERNPSFSIRAWAKQMGLKYHAPLHAMIKGKRRVPKSYTPLFINTLNLDVNEGNYFDTLVCLNRSTLPQEREVYLERLSYLSPKKKLEMKEVENFHSLKDPLHIIITELSDLKGFEPSAKWIQSKIGFKRSIQQINNAIERLILLGLMKRLDDGKLVKCQDHIYSKSDVIDIGLQKYHQNTMSLAAMAIEKQAPQDREYNGYCINMKSKDIPRAKEFLRKFMNDFAAEFEAQPDSVENTYQLNTQLFNLTNKIED